MFGATCDHLFGTLDPLDHVGCVRVARASSEGVIVLGGSAVEDAAAAHQCQGRVPPVTFPTGTVHQKIITRNDSTTLIEFLTELAQTLYPTKKIHLIPDNGSSHTSTA